MNKKLKWGSIIPLIGGFPLGSKLATGSDPDFMLSYRAFDANDSLCTNYFKDVPYFTLDENDSVNKNNELFKNIDFLNSTCPCAGLSMMNSSNRGADAPQNEWLFKTAEFVLENLQPKVFFGENAPGLFTNLGKEVADKLYEIGKKHGYSFSMIRTNTALHGIPQKRIRTFYFFWNSPTAPIMNYYSRESKHYLDFLKEIPADATQQEIGADKSSDVSLKYLQERFTTEQLFTNRSTVDIIFDENLYDDYISFLESKNDEVELKKMRHIKGKLDNGKGFWNSFPHLASITEHDVCSVTGRSMDRLIHPFENRTFTYREYMHLMGMPHDFQLMDPKKDLNKIAQNVPACTARDMSLEVEKFIKGKLKPSDTDYLKQNNISQKMEDVNVRSRASVLF